MGFPKNRVRETNQAELWKALASKPLHDAPGRLDAALRLEEPAVKPGNEMGADELPPFNEKGELYVVVETSQGSPNKLKWDPEVGRFRLSGVLPAGAVFPYDFGFVPGTQGEDGDPLDVLLLMDAPVPAGALVEARLIGVIEAEQTEDGKTVRNDRLLAVATASHTHRSVRELTDLDRHLLEQIEHFFASYNEIKGKEFRPLARRGSAAACRMVHSASSEGKTKK